MLRADWLSQAVTVPYVPTLGPVHPNTDLARLFTAVHHLEAGSFLPYDKQHRWTTHKDETVLICHTEHGPELTRIVTLNRRNGGCLRLYHYAAILSDPDEARDAAGKLAAEYGAQRGTVIWFQRGSPPPDVHAARVWLAPAAADTELVGPAVTNLDDCPLPVRATFTQFCKSLRDPGMAALGRHHANDCLDGPVLVAINDERIVGAIGPLRTMLDPAGTRQLLPQYFAVLPGHRRAGHGRVLWRAAQRWGLNGGAAYQLMQATVAGAADRLYRAEGARDLGIVCTAAA